MSTDYLPTIVGNLPPVPPTDEATPSGPIRLQHVAGSLTGGTQEFAGPQLTLGRRPESDVRFDQAVDILVSGRHARIFRDDAGWWLEDVGSTNGTFHQNQKLQGKARLRQGDVITLGAPEAKGCASFVVHLGGGGGLLDDAAPPLRSGVFAMTCSSCSATLEVHYENIGQSVACPSCGKPVTIALPKVAPFRGAASPPAATQAPGAPALAAPAAAAESPGFFGKIKGTFRRMAQRREIQGQIKSWQGQLPAANQKLTQACSALGRELWQSGPWATPVTPTLRKERPTFLNPLPANAKVSALCQQMDDVQDQLASLTMQESQRVEAMQDWLKEWEARHAALTEQEAQHLAARQAAQAAQAAAQGAVQEALAAPMGALGELGRGLSALAADASPLAPDDIVGRYDAMIERLAATGGEGQGRLAGVEDLLATRRAATATAAEAAAEHQQTTSQLQESTKARSDREAAEAAAAAAAKARQDQLQKQAAQLDAPFAAAFAELARQYLEIPDRPALPWSSQTFEPADRALHRVREVESTIAQLNQQLAQVG